MVETAKRTIMLEIPRQQFGGCHDTETKQIFDSEKESEIAFSRIKERLFSINRWKEFSGFMSAEFVHMDSLGNRVDRTPLQGDLVRIQLPLVSNFDWVEITRLSINDFGNTSVIMSCRPCEDPNTINSHIAHFYCKNATSNFILEKHGNEICVGVFGRNEAINYDAPFWSKIRNFLIAIGGLAGIAKLQWYFLVKGLTDVHP